jgi:hypothetical protein
LVNRQISSGPDLSSLKIDGRVRRKMRPRLPLDQALEVARAGIPAVAKQSKRPFAGACQEATEHL